MYTISFDDFTVSRVKTLEEAKTVVLEAHANGVSIDSIEDDEGNTYGIEWDIKIEKLDD